jgi:hypothetical protein
MMRKTLCAAALCTATLAQATPLEITYTAVVTRSTGGSGLPALGDTLSGRVVFDDTEGAYSPCTSPMQPRPPMPWLGIEAELIELLRLAPPDPEPMLASLQRTGRAGHRCRRRDGGCGQRAGLCAAAAPGGAHRGAGWRSAAAVAPDRAAGAVGGGAARQRHREPDWFAVRAPGSSR